MEEVNEMKDILYKLLESLGYEVYEQGSFTDDEEYPQSFFTIWNDDTEPFEYYDNKENGYVWSFTLNFYSVDPSLTTSALIDVKNLLIKNNWIVPGKGKDVYSASKKHSGRSIKVKFIERGEKNG